MKILQLMPAVPASNGGGGQVRTFHFSRALAEMGELTMCILSSNGRGTPSVELVRICRTILQPMDRFNADATQYRRSMGGIRRAISILGTPWRHHGRHLMIAAEGNSKPRTETSKACGKILYRWYAALLRAEVRIFHRVFRFLPAIALIHDEEFEELLPEIERNYSDGKPDVIWVEYSYLYPYALRLKHLFPNALIACNAHNVEWLFIKRLAGMAKTASSRNWWIISSSIVRKWERRMLEDSDLVFACSDVDASHFRALVPEATDRIKVSPNGVDTKNFQPSASRNGEPRLLFTGSAGYGPNDDAVAWFMQEIFPLIRQRLPEVHLCLAGLNAALHWTSFAETTSGVEIASDVPDMRPYFDQASVCVVPLRAGSGTRLKILEAMGMGRAVVASGMGAEGIEAIDGIHYLRADTAEEFANAVIGLLTDPSKRSAMEAVSRELVCKQYDWSKISAEAVGVLKMAVSSQSSRESECHTGRL